MVKTLLLLALHNEGYNGKPSIHGAINFVVAAFRAPKEEYKKDYVVEHYTDSYQLKKQPHLAIPGFLEFAADKIKKYSPQEIVMLSEVNLGYSQLDVNSITPIVDGLNTLFGKQLPIKIYGVIGGGDYMDAKDIKPIECVVQDKQIIIKPVPFDTLKFNNTVKDVVNEFKIDKPITLYKEVQKIIPKSLKQSATSEMLTKHNEKKSSPGLKYKSLSDDSIFLKKTDANMDLSNDEPDQKTSDPSKSNLKKNP